MPLKLKVELFQQYELTVLLNGMECRNLTKTQLSKLERYQIRQLRHLAHSPAHIYRESNEKLRRRLGVPTIESRLRRSRLNNLRNVFQHPDINQQLIAVLFGTSQWDPREPETGNLPYMKQMHDDIVALYKQVGIIKDMLPITWAYNTVNHSMRTWLAQRTHGDLDKVYKYTSTTEQFYRTARNRRKGPSPELPPDAPTCKSA